jgi:hypothetical protein
MQGAREPEQVPGGGEPFRTNQDSVIVDNMKVGASVNRFRY